MSEKTNASELKKRKMMAFLASKSTQTPEDLARLGWTPKDLARLGWTPKDLARLGWTPEDLARLGWTPKDLARLGWTPEDLARLGWTPKDLAEFQKDWESIPVLEKPYSRLLAAVRAKERIHDQSTWGPEDFNPKLNFCKTPMCTAGHLVNMCGESGYNLMKKYGWIGAATIIHKKSRPDVPPQNFKAIPQAFAMAYIEERAAEEEAGFEK